MKSKKGFTLVELLVVIAIIGILSTVAVVNLNMARNKAKAGALEYRMRSIFPAIFLCFNEGYDIYDGGGGICDLLGGDWDPGTPMCIAPGAEARWPNVADIADGISTSPCYSNKETGEFSFSAAVAGFTVSCTEKGCSTAPTP